jgi:hypothetical protein
MVSYCSKNLTVKHNLNTTFHTKRMKRYTESLCSTMLLLEYKTANKILTEFTMLLLVINNRHLGILYNATAKENLELP